MSVSRRYAKSQTAESAFSIDRALGVIEGVSLCRTGEALGHYVWADSDFVHDVVTLGASMKNGLKARFGHPFLMDGIGSEVGVFKNFRYVESKKETAEAGYTVAYAIADFHAFKPSKKNADAIDHLFSMAEQAPDMFGCSIVFWSNGFKEDEDGIEVIENPCGHWHDTIKKLSACDFVSDPALNPNGLWPKEFSDHPSVAQWLSNLASNPEQALLNVGQKLFSLLKGHSPHVNPMSKAESPPAISEFRGKLSARKRRGLTSFWEGTDADGQMLRTPSDEPEIGDPLVIVDAEGGETPAPAGDFVIAGEGSSWTLTTDGDGFLIAVLQKAEGRSATPAKPTEPKPIDSGTADVQRQFAQMQEQFDALQKQNAEQAEALKKQAADMAKLRTVKDAEPEFINDKPVIDAGKKGFHGQSEKTEVAEVMHLLATNRRSLNRAQAMGDWNEVHRLSAHQPKQMATGTGWDIQGPTPLPDLLERSPIFTDIIKKEIISELASDRFTVIQEYVRGDSELTIGMPLLSDLPGDGYIQPGIPCDPTPTGALKVTANKMELKPWHYPREFCVREAGWGNFLNAKYQVNNQEIPLQAVFLDYLVQNVIARLNYLIYFGVDGTNAFDGLITKAIADVNVLKYAYTANTFDPLAWTATDNPYTYIRNLDNTMPPTMRQRTQRETLDWQIAEPAHRLYRDYIFQENNKYVQLDPQGQPRVPLTSNALFYPSYLLQDATLTAPDDMFNVLSFKKNLFIGISQLEGMDGERILHYEPFRGVLQFLLYAHIGVGYADSSQLILGTPDLTP